MTEKMRRIFAGKDIPLADNPEADEYVHLVRDDIDWKIVEVLLNESLVYVRAPRKTGKSTLRNWLEKRALPKELAASKYVIAKLDLVGVSQAEEEERLIEFLSRRLDEAYRTAAATTGLAPDQTAAIRALDSTKVNWFWRAMAELARATGHRVVVLADEIEEVFKFPDIGRQWLLALREAHERFDDASGLHVCLFGRSPPSTLVRAAETTPFNSAREFLLPDFTDEQTAELIGDIRFGSLPVGGEIARRVHDLFGGQPYLTARLAQHIRQSYEAGSENFVLNIGPTISEFVERDPDCRPGSAAYDGIDGLFERKYADRWPLRDALASYARMLDSVEDLANGTQSRPKILFDPWNEGQKMLEAVGMARVDGATGQEDRFLVTRNIIVPRIFDRRWVDRKVAALIGVGAAEVGAAVASERLAEMERLAVDELCRSAWGLEHELTIAPNSGRELIEDTLFEFEMSRKWPDERLTLQMYRGIGQLGGQLWRRQVRILRRLTAFGRESALPVIYRGAVLDKDVAYIVSYRPQFSAATELPAEFFRQRRDHAIDTLRGLLTGLNVLAGLNIVLHNVSLETLRFDVSQQDTLLGVKFTNFEFAAVLRSIVSSGESQDAVIAEEGRRRQRQAFLRQGTAVRPFAAPEHLRNLFSPSTERRPIRARTDVFSLGMIAIYWLLGLPDTDDFIGVLTGSPDLGAYDAKRHEEFLGKVRTSLTRAQHNGGLPIELADILRDMIASDPDSRLSPFELLRKLDENAKTIIRWAKGDTRPRIICYTYGETAKFLESQGLLTSGRGTEENQEDVREFLEKELRSAKLYYTKSGFLPYAGSNASADDRADYARAQWVIVGGTYAFYCHLFLRRTPGSRTGTLVPHALRIAYAVAIRRGVWREVPENAQPLEQILIEVLDQRSTELDAVNAAKFAPWEPILDVQKARGRPPSFDVAHVAMNWLDRALGERLALQRFPVKAISPAGHHRRYELDVAKYRIYRDASTMRTIAYQVARVRDERDMFDRIFQEAMEKDDTRLRICSSESDSWSSVELDNWQVGGIWITGFPLPDQAEIELASVGLQQIPLKAQRNAIGQLDNDPILLDQLVEPHAIVQDPSVGATANLGDLRGRAKDIVSMILGTEPFFALQGPPGTGKTTVMSAVVSTMLEQDPTARILVTAQSHATVDHLAERIGARLKVQESETAQVRMASDLTFGKGRVDPRVARLQSGEIVERWAQRAARRCEAGLAASPDAGMRTAYELLLKATTDSYVEVGQRVEEGANLVYSTTAGTKLIDKLDKTGRSRFDLAIVDETSKAWPNEIILPLLMAERYLLVGDHKQLPPFDAQTVRRMLALSIERFEQEFQPLSTNREAVEAWLRLFGSFFDVTNRKLIDLADQRLGGVRLAQDCTDSLDVQFRMRPTIAQIVSEAFYGNTLKTDPEIAKRPIPAWIPRLFENAPSLEGDALWIDTDVQGLFRNTGSATDNPQQAELAANIVHRALELIGKDGDESKAASRPIVVLSPYQRQNKIILARLRERGIANAESLVHTVDSFQGQEADVVVLSLTRTAPVESDRPQSAHHRLGFLIEGDRINVALSRAREKLIVLGDFNFFAEAGRVQMQRTDYAAVDLSFWTRICDAFQKHGTVATYGPEIPTGLRLRLRQGRS